MTPRANLSLAAGRHDPRLDIAAAVRDMLPAFAAVASADPTAPAPELPAAEAAAVSNAVEGRRREFAAGRLAARRAMAGLGLPEAPIPCRTDRSPVWPEGVVGSISHSAEACLAIVARAGDCRSVGLDLEPDKPLESMLLPTICTPAERAFLAAHPEGATLATVIFSAKESAYKAQYPLTGQVIDFQDVELTLDVEAGSFTVEFGAQVLAGTWRRVAGHVVTVIVVPNENGGAEEPEPARIDPPYLLVCPIAYHEATDGSVWVDRLWHRDLLAHLDYLADLRIAAPRAPFRPGAELLRVEAPAGTRLAFVPLPEVSSLVQAVFRLPATAAALFRAIRAARVVHSGAAGWPIPLGAIANPLALFFGRPLVIVIESAFWRPVPGTVPRLQDRLRSVCTEWLARWSVRRASLAILTSEAYRETLAAGAVGKVMVAPATWISDADILSDATAEAAWASKPKPTRLAFAGRLNAEKGVGVLLQALRSLDRQGVAVSVDIIGAGPMLGECRQVAGELAHAQLVVHDPVDYGPAFFAFLRQRSSVIVPSITDEQPRILYDAFSQGVPVIATATGGHRDCVQAGENGVLVPAGDAAALAAAIAAAVADPAGQRRMGLAALQAARARTHEAMHRTRAEALRSLIAAEGAAPAGWR